MNQLNWVYAIGEINPEFVDEAKEEEEEHFSTGTLSFPNKKKTIGIKRVAMIFLAAAVSVFGLLMLNENVRAAVLGILVHQEEQKYYVHFNVSDPENDSADDADIYNVTLGYIPDGYFPREITEEDLGEHYDPRIRIIRLTRTEDKELTQYEMANSSNPQVIIWINYSDDFDWWYNQNAYGAAYNTKINGNDALIIDETEESAKTGLKHIGGQILFGAGKIAVRIIGVEVSMDELFRIAENISW